MTGSLVTTLNIRSCISEAPVCPTGTM
jgi:hypothetical protein